jgi:hypothetical protein
MSGSESAHTPPPVPDSPADLAKANPKVDVDKLRDAQAALEELRKAGVMRREYDIASPYERRPRRVRQAKEHKPTN